jgi:hypothetical protein
LLFIVRLVTRIKLPADEAISFNQPTRGVSVRCVSVKRAVNHD